LVCHGGFADRTCIEPSQEQLASVCVSRGFSSTVFSFRYFFRRGFCFIPVTLLQKSTSGQGYKKIKRQDDDYDQEEDKQQGKEGDNEEDDKKRMYKKKIDVRQGEKDYKKWMTAIKEMKKEKGKQGVDMVDKRLSSIIGNYRKQLMQRGVDVTERIQEVVDVPDDDDYVDFEAVGICGV